MFDAQRAKDALDSGDFLLVVKEATAAYGDGNVPEEHRALLDEAYHSGERYSITAAKSAVLEGHGRQAGFLAELAATYYDLRIRSIGISGALERLVSVEAEAQGEGVAVPGEVAGLKAALSQTVPFSL
ncbi:hypothetical protein HYV82_06580 [Candidatus Woesearchaeota archaeon]|nr:hypothetical protein [Candidatus Woesearchaeota archaeon]